MKIRTSSVLVALFFLGISIITIIEGIKLKSHISASDFLVPLRPDIYLQSVGWLMAFIAVCFIVKDIFFTKEQNMMKIGTKVLDVILTIAIFVVYIFSADWIGYILSSFGFYFVFLRWIGKYSYFKSSIISIIATTCLYLTFVKGFDMILPTGIIVETFLGT